MKSRVHLALTYNPPETETRRRIRTQYPSTTPGGETEIDRDSAAARWPKPPSLGGEAATPWAYRNLPISTVDWNV
ncbi:hypothetical protein DL771_010299 [Monosporascus sp. 5C6A]|nr:hypothetical protein DL771_010299 [Monosporascus sp. 5C6A]